MPYDKLDIWDFEGDLFQLSKKKDNHPPRISSISVVLAIRAEYYQLMGHNGPDCKHNKLPTPLPATGILPIGTTEPKEAITPTQLGKDTKPKDNVAEFSKANS